MLRPLLSMGAAASVAQALTVAVQLPLATDKLVYDSAGSNGRDLVMQIAWSIIVAAVLAAAALFLRRRPPLGRVLAYLGTGAFLARSVCVTPPMLTTGIEGRGTLLTPAWATVEITATAVGCLTLAAAIVLLRKASRPQ